MIHMLLSFYGNTRSLSVYVENSRFAYGSNMCISSDIWYLFPHFLYNVSSENDFPCVGPCVFLCLCMCLGCWPCCVLRINFVKHWYMVSAWQNWSLKFKMCFRGGAKPTSRWKPSFYFSSLMASWNDTLAEMFFDRLPLNFNYKRFCGGLGARSSPEI